MTMLAWEVIPTAYPGNTFAKLYFFDDGGEDRGRGVVGHCHVSIVSVSNRNKVPISEVCGYFIGQTQPFLRFRGNMFCPNDPLLPLT